MRTPAAGRAVLAGPAAGGAPLATRTAPASRSVAAHAAVRCAGVGSSVPPAVLTNDDLAALGLDTNDAWIAQRTGIRCAPPAVASTGVEGGGGLGEGRGGRPGARATARRARDLAAGGRAAGPRPRPHRTPACGRGLAGGRTARGERQLPPKRGRGARPTATANEPRAGSRPPLPPPPPSQRHILASGESLSQHASAAAAAALAMAGVAAADVDMVVLATSSPDDLFGSACEVAATLGATSAVAFDLTAACSGFVVGLITGSQFIKTGAARTVLVVGADALSRYVDWRDRGTCILFGDGAGAVVLTVAADANAPCALLGASMGSDGAGAKHLNARFACDGGKATGAEPSARGAYANIAMNGQEVFKFAVRAVPNVLEAALKDAGLTPSSIDWLVLHQANQRILDAAATRLGVPADRVVSNLARYGNTSAASIPLALDEAVRGGRIKAGDTVALAGFGAGLTFAGALVRWG